MTSNAKKINELERKLERESVMESGGIWTAYTPNVTAASGALTTVSATGIYSIIGKTVLVNIDITITTNGTGSVAILATLPVNAVGTQIIAGREDAVTGLMLQGLVGTNYCTIFAYDNSYPGGDGRILRLTGLYRAE